MTINDDETCKSSSSMLTSPMSQDLDSSTVASSSTEPIIVQADHVPLASAVLIDEGLRDDFQDEPTSSIRSHSRQEQPSSVVYESLETCPIIQDNGMMVMDDDDDTSPLSSLEEGQSSTGTRRSKRRAVLLHHLGRESKRIECPLCHEEMDTVVAISKIGGFAMVLALFIFFVAWPFFWIPLVLPHCRVTKHFCSKCHCQVGETDPCA
eukprot:CAMPEP_0172451862 /NCGR_PEP_ID=MMETSP1065-20121228/9715_1 /TAXON_ID=265537 /ORGANISM="Amphiprora paludosa, Strain CCMP125" /LENGTH=207 /DNA_ID=CAMNT_0013203833 /DNA_START=21 /DNA_END=644 /DNA_ORIENTATION=-